ncbi:hypothetical protein PAXRUDRAFT_146163 [Paxillus rubicundulus Ve08.2h10]|uniref:Uncharacterized protein n=1 Tax=Paxillus rubicundulus Ve08.2h10 TaxID=930991 RepID=A0A0D0DUT9_9AGAM|nr:hypothetical protein PAXRUDRAFT_146163 [Paxillus rubicundulus Ve08.2h10]
MCLSIVAAELPSTHDVSNFIHNLFVEFLQELRARIQSEHSGRVSTTTDLLSVNQTKASFMGITAHWISQWCQFGAVLCWVV